jgi:hypothetical protein
VSDGHSVAIFSTAGAGILLAVVIVVVVVAG